jgi:hypothetical protein
VELHPLIAEIVDSRWQPGIGDPTPIGWVTIVAYFAASWACWRAAAAEGQRAHGGRSGPAPLWLLLSWRAAAAEGQRAHGDRSGPAPFWLLLTGFLLLLGINKQLDLQSALTDFGRRLAREQGWYDRRQEVQALFIALIAAISLVVLGAFGWLARAALRSRLLALLGLVFLVSFILIRASSFHQVDVLIGLRLGGLKWNWILELGGIGCVGLAAVQSGHGGCDGNPRRLRSGSGCRWPGVSDGGHVRYRIRR